ncbi:MAG: acyl-CoA dehydrogenase family protein [Immundisolibacterales bacterium]|nr:acyl-CoA dehydrogenase family protein [Immundisolibacterales bacterium]
MLLTEEQRAIRDAARAFAATEIAPHAAAWERDGGAPRELYRRMGEVGLMGVCVPPEHGGAGADFVSYVLAMEEVAAADCGIANVMAAQNSPVAAALAKHGTAAQKEAWLAKLARGELIGAILLTEPHTGSDAAAIRTRARRPAQGEGWTIDGSKSFITAGSTADLAMIVAVTDPSAGKRGITCFLCPTDRAGYRVVRKESKLGHRNNDTCQIALDGLEAGHDEVLGKIGSGLGIALGHLSAGRIGVAAQAVGTARAALEAARDYAREREAFGKPIIEHQAIAFRLAEMATEVEVARQMYLHAAALEAAGESSIREASMAKLFASEMSERVCSGAIQIHGGYGYLGDFPVEKYYRDARVLQIYEGTSEVQKIVIGRML